MIDKETRRKIQGYLDFLQENYEIENDYTNYFDEDEEEIPDEFEDEGGAYQDDGDDKHFVQSLHFLV